MNFNIFDGLIKRIARSLDARGISYMIIGGQAILRYGIIRLTEDIDITLGTDIDNLTLIKEVCKILKLKIIPKDIEDFVSKTMVLPAIDPRTDMRVDFIFSFSQYEREALKRARRVGIRGQAVRFAAAEDLIMHKIFAGRASDLEDARNLIIKIGEKKIHSAYIKKWLRELEKASEKNNLLSMFNDLLKNN